MKFQPIPRRTFLRGVGASIALPLLEGMAPATAAAGATTEAAGAPTRLAFFYVPNGVHMPYWTPETEGKDFELPKTLEPLAEHRDKFSILSGLAADNARAKGDGPGDHARSTAAFLTGRHPVKTDGKDIRAGVSVDQIAAKYLGQDTRFPTLEIGCEHGRLAGSCDSGYSCAYSHSLSWRSETQPAGKEVRPELLFDRLFGNGNTNDMAEAHYRRKAKRQSVLDFVTDDAQAIRKRMGKADRHKIDQYLDSIREVERRIDGSGLEEIAQSMPRPNGKPGDFGQHMRLMGDLMTLAFQTDSTRIATFLVANEGSNRKYKELGIREGHHGMTHHLKDPENVKHVSSINRYHIEQLAYMLTKMSKIEEGDRTLLDNTAIVYGSAISDGNRHQHNDLPVLLAGGAGGVIETGYHRRYERDTPLMNLFLTLLQRTGVPVESLGDSNGVLPLS